MSGCPPGPIDRYRYEAGIVNTACGLCDACRYRRIECLLTVSIAGESMARIRPSGAGITSRFCVASVTGSGWRACGCVLEEPLVCLGDPGAVPGGEQIQEQAADHGYAEAGIGPGRRLVGPGFDQGGGDWGNPGFDDPVKESLGAGAATQGVGVQLKEQPLLRPQHRGAEALP